jgi:ADP-ribose pyrophosphatase YjhB (NUDIX family)
VTLEERTRERVDRETERLRERVGEFGVEEEAVPNEPGYFEEGRDLAESGWLGDAGAFVTDDEDRALLIRHEDDAERWGTPGGGHEPDETIAETASREVREETGVDCALTGVYWARRKVIVHEDDPERKIHILTVIFEANYEGGGIDIGDDEIVDAEWFGEPPDEVHDFLEATIEEWTDGEIAAIE